MADSYKKMRAALVTLEVEVARVVALQLAVGGFTCEPWEATDLHGDFGADPRDFSPELQRYLSLYSETVDHLASVRAMWIE